MIGDVYIAQYSGISIKLLAINVRAEEIINTICHWTPSVLYYEEIPLTDTLTLYQTNLPEKQLHYYFSTAPEKDTILEIRRFENWLHGRKDYCV